MSKSFLKIIYLSLVFMILEACAGDGHAKQEKKTFKETAEYAAGQLTDTVKCIADTSYSYALYLPGSYQPETEHPVLFFFDAHKRGKLPVKKYKALADKYGYILAGSYNSTNGQSRIEMERAIRMMTDDVLNRFRVDPERIYTGGFSGGARVAAYVALFKRKIAGTVGCAAGFPQINTQPNTGFAYIALVGDKDFNYLELKNLDRSLEGSGIRHFLRVYDGKHDWPPEQVMEDAFLFFQFEAMRKTQIPVDRKLVRKFAEQNNDSVEKASNNRDWLGLAYWLNRAVVYLSGISDVEKEKEMLAKLKHNPQYQKHLQEELDMEKTEHELQQSYVRAMENRGKDWWVKNINELIRKAKNGNSKDQRLMNTRLLNYLSLVSYMYATRALRDNITEHADKYLTIYEMVDPDNPEVYYLKAVRFARLKKDKEALTELQKAAAHGFHEYSRMTQDKNFAGLKGDTAF
ncbi:MAG: hypothetical protein GXO86_12255, partial [Chlorobi bacterium]|nr:hypothetical protein [Chlorobiota bacterium]